MILLILGISIILDGIFNLYFSNSYIMSLFSIISLIYIYPFFENKRNYIIFSSVFGFIYDLFFTNFFILNLLIFFLISGFINIYIKKFNFSFISTLILNLFVIIIYQLLLVIIFHLTFYNVITLKEFIFIIPHFLFINLFYGILLYLNHLRIIYKKNHILY